MNPIVDEMTSFLVMDVLEKAKEMQKNGINVIHLEVGEPDFDVPECVNRAVADALANHETHYTHSLGMIELREEIAALYKREYGVTVDPDCVVITTGSSPAILFVMLMLCQQGSGGDSQQSWLCLLPQFRACGSWHTYVCAAQS